MKKLSCLLLLIAWGPVLLEARQGISALPSRRDSGLRHCTVITVSRGERVFFLGNDDWHERDSTYWVDRGSDSRYGAIYFGEPDNVQQGFNEKGLAYDANGLPPAPLRTHSGRETVAGGYTSYPIEILRECATVQEVISWVRAHRWHQEMHDQLHFADDSGDAVVISAGPDGKVVFTRKPAGDGYLVSTNFNLANPSNGNYPCWRYTRAQRMLAGIGGEHDLTVERMAEIADAVHLESPGGWTIYSVVADLSGRRVYVFYMFQYDAPIVLKIDEEIATPGSPRSLSGLFPEETRQRAARAYHRLMDRSARCNALGLIWLGLVAASLITLVFIMRPVRGDRALWVSMVIVHGPIGLLVYLMTARGRRNGILVEAAGDLPPLIVGWAAALIAVILVPEIRQSRPLQPVVLYIIPLFFGLLLYQAPILARLTGIRYARVVRQRLPAMLVSTHLALAGLLATTLPLILWNINSCGFRASSLLQWWGISVAGALGGGLFLCAYHSWAFRRGFGTWTVLSRDQGDSESIREAVVSPSWGRLWLWILLSFVLMVAGAVLGAAGAAMISGSR
jgi:hypothetical protein